MTVVLILLGIVFLIVIYLKESNKEKIVDDDIPEDDYVPETMDFTVGDIVFSMIKVEKGTFLFGYDAGSKEQQSQKEITIQNDFYMGELQVTQGLWESVMGYNNSHFGNGSNDFFKEERSALPVERVRWNECVEFTDKLNQMFASKLRGMKFRLPTEEEWEFAAKGGNRSRGYIYSGSNIMDKVATYDYDYDITRPVAINKPNELGLYDMTGNVWEWCSNRYLQKESPSWFSRNKQDSIVECGICRGGSYYQNEDDCHITVREGRMTAHGYENVGFRLCLS